MLYTVILFLSMMFHCCITEYARRTYIQYIEECDDADLSCVYRKRFSQIRLLSAIPFCFAFLYLVLYPESNQYRYNSIIIGFMLVWSSFINKNALPLSGIRPKDIKEDDFVLYLRGFSYDNYSVTPKDLDKKNHDINNFSEAQFMHILKQYFPVYAVGMTKELNSPIGAVRIYLNDKEWEDEVLKLIEKARLIVILLNDSYSCIWEVQKSCKYSSKVVYISNDEWKTAKIRKSLNQLHLYPLPIGMKTQTFSYQDINKETKVVAYENTEKDYMRIIKALMMDKFKLKRCVFSHKFMNSLFVCCLLLFLVLWILFIGFKSILLGILVSIIFLITPFYIYDKVFSIYKRKQLRLTLADKRA